MPNVVLQDTQPGGGRKSILGNELNYFRQLYVENSGRPGDLRVSEVPCSLILAWQDSD